jgi:hypothetical protein
VVTRSDRAVDCLTAPPRPAVANRWDISWHIQRLPPPPPEPDANGFRAITLTTRARPISSSKSFWRIVSLIFMRVNSKCAHQVRPPAKRSRERLKPEGNPSLCNFLLGSGYDLSYHVREPLGVQRDHC